MGRDINADAAQTRDTSWTFSGDTERLLKDVEDRRITESILIMDNATLIIDNSRINITQENDFEFKVEIMDHGRMILESGVITSNMKFIVHLNDHGTIELLNSSVIESDALIVKGEGAVLAIKNSTVKTTNMTLDEMSELYLYSLKGNKKLTGLRVGNCRSSLSILDCDIDGIIIDAVGEVEIHDTMIQGNSWLYECRGKIEISDSTIDNLTIDSCVELVARGTDIDHMVIIQCSGTEDEGLKFYDCVLGDIVVDLVPNLLVSGGEVIPSKKGFLDNLCTSGYFQADRGAYFEYPLTFSGNSIAKLMNISVERIEAREDAKVKLVNWGKRTEINPRFHTPELEVFDRGRIELYRTLEILVRDRNNATLSGAEVGILEDVGNETLYSRETDENGMAQFIVLTSIIEKDGEDFKGYYRADVTYSEGKNIYQEFTTTTMADDLYVEIRLDAMKKEDSKEDGGSLGWLWAGALVLMIVVLIGIVAFRANRR